MQASLTKNSDKNIGVKQLIMRLRNLCSSSSSRMALIMIFIISAFFAWCMQPNTLPIKHIDIEGELIQLDIKHLEQMVTSQSSGFFNTDIDLISNELLALPWVKQASIIRIWPDRLRIIIHEQVAIAKWADLGFLNAEGDYFSPATNPPLITADMPILEGYKESQKIVVQKFLSLTNDYDLNVVRLHLDERRAWKLELDNGLVVILGKKDFQKRIERFLYVAMNALGDQLYQAKTIDLRYMNGFSVQWQ